MLEKDARRKVGGRSEPGYAESFSFELVQLSYSGTDEDDEIILGLHRRNERQVITLQAGLHDRADVHQRRGGGRPCLRRGLAATEEDRVQNQARPSEPTPP